MYKHILVPVALDHERDVAAALRVARALLSKGGHITALHVIDVLPSYATQYLPPDHETAHRKEIANMLHHVLRDEKKLTPAIVSGHAGRAIVDFAQEHEVDCIVLASHRPGLQDYFLGSTAARVVRHATCAVHVLR